MSVASMLRSYGQTEVEQHLLSCSEEERVALEKQLDGLDVKWVMEEFRNFDSSDATKSVTTTPSPLPDVARLRGMPEDEIQRFTKLGLTNVAEGRVAYLVLAGGQGTRLGSSAPKGCYDICLPSHRTLFQLIIQRLRRLSTMAGGAPVPLYVMTSDATDAETKSFLREKDFYGMSESDIVFFSQLTLPCVDLQGNLMLEARDRVCVAPDGNGGIYRALALSGALADMERRGIKYVHVGSVDNALTRPADPVFMGFCVERGVECGAKVVPKSGPTEAVGVLCLDEVSKRVRVVEYSELSAEAAHAKDETSGELLLNAGNICNHFYTVSFLQKLGDAKLPLHKARKKIATLQASGATATPSEPNGIKMEMFIFDAFGIADSFAALEVNRSDEFAPVKNAPGTASDSPDTARALLMAQSRRFIEAAGGSIDGDGDVEVSPLVSYSGEGLDERCAGKTFTPPVMIEP